MHGGALLTRQDNFKKGPTQSKREGPGTQRLRKWPLLRMGERLLVSPQALAMGKTGKQDFKRVGEQPKVL